LSSKLIIVFYFIWVYLIIFEVKELSVIIRYENVLLLRICKFEERDFLAFISSIVYFKGDRISILINYLSAMPLKDLHLISNQFYPKMFFGNNIPKSNSIFMDIYYGLMACTVRMVKVK